MSTDNLWNRDLKLFGINKWRLFIMVSVEIKIGFEELVTSYSYVIFVELLSVFMYNKKKYYCVFLSCGYNLKWKIKTSVLLTLLFFGNFRFNWYSAKCTITEHSNIKVTADTSIVSPFPIRTYKGHRGKLLCLPMFY